MLKREEILYREPYGERKSLWGEEILYFNIITTAKTHEALYLNRHAILNLVIHPPPCIRSTRSLTELAFNEH